MGAGRNPAALGLLFTWTRGTHLIILNRRNIGIKKKSWRRFCILHKILYFFRLAVRQVVFTDVLNVGQLDVDVHSFAPIGFQKTDADSNWFLLKWHCIGMKGLARVQLHN